LIDLVLWAGAINQGVAQCRPARDTLPAPWGRFLLYLLALNRGDYFAGKGCFAFRFDYENRLPFIWVD
jgi:hypothetical protein